MPTLQVFMLKTGKYSICIDVFTSNHFFFLSIIVILYKISNNVSRPAKRKQIDRRVIYETDSARHANALRLFYIIVIYTHITETMDIIRIPPSSDRRRNFFHRHSPGTNEKIVVVGGGGDSTQPEM